MGDVRDVAAVRAGEHDVEALVTGVVVRIGDLAEGRPVRDRAAEPVAASEAAATAMTAVIKIRRKFHGNATSVVIRYPQPEGVRRASNQGGIIAYAIYRRISTAEDREPGYLDANRVPDRFQIHKGGDFPWRLDIDGPVYDPFIVCGKSLELRVPVGTGQINGVDVHVAGENRASSLRRPVTRLTPPGTSEVASIGKLDRCKGEPSEAIRTTVFPPTITGASRDTSPARGGSSGASTPTTPSAQAP